jgi:adenine-specific DNA methylase
MNFKALESAAKLRGGYYTNPKLAAFLLRWVLQQNPRRVLEPSCGDGVFIRTLLEMGGEGVESFVGFEIEPAEASKAVASARRAAWLEVHAIDFLGWSLPRLGEHHFDAAVGNPPFIRYQYLDAALQDCSAKIFHRFTLPFTKHTNAWVPFVIASLAMLRPGGRLAMVVPSELLHVLHAQSLRTFLADECSRVLVIDPQQLWFEGALQGAVLLLAEKKEKFESPSLGVAIHQTTSDDFLDTDPGELFARADYANGDTVRGKWMPALLTARERQLLKSAAALPSIERLCKLSDADVGIVTGANKFFLVPDAVVQEYDLQEWAYPMFGRSEHVRGVLYDENTHQENKRVGLPANFLWFRGAVRADMPSAAQRYLDEGEREGLHGRYKCRMREPWYVVPSVHTAPIGMLKRSHAFPRLVLNEANAYTTDTAYRLRPLPGVDALALVTGFVNSLTALTAELEGRHYGGGVLELVPSELAKLLVPHIPAQRADLMRLDATIRAGIGAEATLEERDGIVLIQAGLSKQECNELRQAWARLKRRRHRDSTSEGELPNLD